MTRLDQLVLDGFRGYGRANGIKFGGGSILVFAPNGYGKSSLTDAFEFLFSHNGTLERLGERDVHTNTGRLPLRNTRRAAGQTATVTLHWKDAGITHTAVREVDVDGNAPPPTLAPLLAKRVVPFVVRGHDLRADVELTTPGQRYQKVAGYLGAARLAELQADFRSLQNRLTRADTSVRRREELQAQVRERIGTTFDLGDEPAALAWAGTVFASLGLQAPLSLSLENPAIRLLGDRAAEERAKRGGDALVRAQGILTNILALDDGRARALAPLELAKDAASRYAALAADTADGRRHALLTPAIAILERDDTTACPVCETMLTATPHADRLRLAEHLRELQRQLGEIAGAKQDAERTRIASRANGETTAGRVRTVGALLALADADDLANSWTAAYDAAEGGDEGPFTAVTQRLAAVLADVNVRRAALAAEGPPVYQTPNEQIRAVVDGVGQRRAIDARAAELAVLHTEVAVVRASVNTAVHAFLQDNVSALADDTAQIYNRIQQGAAVPVTIDIRLTDPDATDARGLEMVLTFPGAGETKPQGYLSDSQLNTLALAFRIAVIRRFNADFPLVVLDDALTSHDAEFRDQAAETIVTELSDLQLLILTHDDMFARLLQDKVKNRGVEAQWSFLRIAMFDLESGPRFLSQVTAEQRIIGAWNRGERAAGTLRSYVEEWLEKTNRAVGGRFVMRRPQSPYNYSHWEMAMTLREVLRTEYDSDNVMRPVPEFAATLAEIVNAVVENEGAHAHDNPYGGADVAMERRFFTRLKRLKEYFRCSACGGKLVYRENVRRAACGRDTCGLVFRLRADPWNPPAPAT